MRFSPTSSRRLFCLQDSSIAPVGIEIENIKYQHLIFQINPAAFDMDMIFSTVDQLMSFGGGGQTQGVMDLHVRRHMLQFFLGDRCNMHQDPPALNHVITVMFK